MMRRRISWPLACFVSICAAALVLAAVCFHTSPRPQSNSSTTRATHPQELGSGLSAGNYVGPDACAECHAERVAEFRTTRHFLANRRPSPEIMPEGFSGGSRNLQFPDVRVQFEMSRVNGQFAQLTSSAADSAAATASPIAYCYGSGGGNDEVYFAWKGNGLYELPVAWLAPSREWGASAFDRHGHGDFSREMTVRCVECHNTRFDHEAGSRNQYRKEEQILGVTCEVCHGPGREHVAFHHEHPHTMEPQAIIRPATLSRDRQMDLCAQCHSNALKHRGPAFSYRPGEVLDDYYYTYHTRYPEDDHVANQTKYLRQSRCYTESTTLSCVSCHDPHRPHSESNAGSKSCAQCHTPEACQELPKIPEPLRTDCAGCHMPEERKIQVFFRTNTDRYVAPVKRYEHRIGIYRDASDKQLWKWHRSQQTAESAAVAARLANSLANRLEERARKFQSEFRFLAAINACRESLQFEQRTAVNERLQTLIATQSAIDQNLQDGLWLEHQQRYEEAIKAFEEVLAAMPDHAMAHSKLGTTLAVVKRPVLAVAHLKQAFAADPNDPYAPAMLGWLSYLDGRPEQALEHYAQAEAVEPYSAKINHQFALALVKLQRFDEAIARYQKSLQINPHDARVAKEFEQLRQRHAARIPSPFSNK